MTDTAERNRANLSRPIEEIFKEPIGWFPTSPSNPSKLIAHKFVNGEWIKLSYAKFVPWPEAFTTAENK